MEAFHSGKNHVIASFTEKFPFSRHSFGRKKERTRPSRPTMMRPPDCVDLLRVASNCIHFHWFTMIFGNAYCLESRELISDGRKDTGQTQPLVEMRERT